MRRAALILAVLWLGCDNGAALVGDLASPDEAVVDQSVASDAGADLASFDQALAIPTTSVSFVEDTADVLNPERGWFGYTAIGGSFDGIRNPSDPVATPPTTVAVVKMDLDQTQAQIPQATLDALTATAASARAAGVKIVLRPLYRPDDTAASGSDPTDASFVISHIHQLGQTLRDQADVIMVVQAGMLGPWGELHDSPLIDSGGWPGIVDALLDEVPGSRMVQVRRPCFKDQLVGGPLMPSEAFDGSKRSRVGLFNDCFLADTISDEGTYESPAGVTITRTVDEWRSWAADDTRYTFVGGETCGNNARADCPTALAELAQFHWSFLGSGWYQPTVGPSGALAACRDEITRRLGYRLVLEQATFSTAVRPGDSLIVSLRLRNDGFAAPLNPRPIFAVLSDGVTTRTAQLASIDPRRFAPGSESSFSVRLGVPATAAEGQYTLSLWLPDASPSLRDRPEYAIRFANLGTWDAATGRNTLTTSLAISAAAVPDTAPPDASF